MSLLRNIVLVLLLSTIASGVARAQTSDLPLDFKGVGLVERLGEVLPMEARFTDSNGNDVVLGKYFGSQKPVVINLVYHNCPMLCSIVLESLTETLKDLAWAPGENFEVLTVSFGAGETPEMAARAKDRVLAKLGKAEADEGWHFLVGDEENILALTDALGFTFKWMESTGEYAHPSALVFVSDEGVVTRYIHGIEYSATKVRRAIVEASEGKVGSALDQILLYCYRYDPASNSYVLHATNLMKLGGLLTLLLIGLGLFVFWRRESRNQKENLNQV